VEDLVHLDDLDPHDFPSEDQLVALGTAAAVRVLQTGAGIEALVCACDPMAFGAARAIEQTGRLIPGDLSIAGFDNAPLARWCRPPLTTVHYPVTEIGRAAVELAIDWVKRGSSTEIKKEILFPPELVVRDSTGPARATPAIHS
jgi:DNA-binding LacI/PurR family transcriptional regulator